MIRNKKRETGSYYYVDKNGKREVSGSDIRTAIERFKAFQQQCRRRGER